VNLSEFSGGKENKAKYCCYILMTNSKAVEYLQELGLTGELQEVDAGNVSQTYRVGEEHYLQFSESSPENLQRGILGLEKQQETDIPVPEIVYADLEEPALVTKALPGESISTTNNEKVYAQAGKIMADIHEQEFDSYGLLKLENGELVPSGSANWERGFSELYHDFIRKGSNLLDDSKAAEIDWFIYERMPEIDEDPGRSLAHFDFHEDNLMHQNGEVTGVLDWDMMRVVDPALEVIRAEHQFNREGKPAKAFRKGYESKREIEINPETEQLYRLTAEIGRLSELEYLQRTQDIKPENMDLEATIENIEEIIEPV